MEQLPDRIVELQQGWHRWGSPVGIGLGTALTAIGSAALIAAISLLLRTDATACSAEQAECRIRFMRRDPQVVRPTGAHKTTVERSSHKPTALRELAQASLFLAPRCT